MPWSSSFHLCFFFFLKFYFISFFSSPFFSPKNLDFTFTCSWDISGRGTLLADQTSARWPIYQTCGVFWVQLKGQQKLLKWFLLSCVAWTGVALACRSHCKDKRKHSRSVSVVRGAGGTAHTEESSPKKLVHALQLFSLLGTTARAEKDLKG